MRRVGINDEGGCERPLVSGRVDGILRLATLIVATLLPNFIATQPASAELKQMDIISSTSAQTPNEAFTRRDATANLIATNETTPISKGKEDSSWRISQDPDKSKGDPYTAMTCLFLKNKKIYCPENGLGSFSISAQRKRVLAWGAGAFHVPNWGKKVVTVLDMEGNLLKEWHAEDAQVFRGKAAPEWDKFIVAYQTESSTASGAGIVRLREFDYDGNTRWVKEYRGTTLGDFGTTSNARHVVLLVGSPYRGGKTIILGPDGALSKEYGPALSFTMAPDDSWVLLWGAKSFAVHDFQSNKAIFIGAVPKADKRRSWVAGASSNGKKIVVLESSVENPRQGTKAFIDAVNIIDLEKKITFRAPIAGKDTNSFKRAHFNDSGRLLLTFGHQDYEYSIEQD